MQNNKTNFSTAGLNSLSNAIEVSMNNVTPESDNAFPINVFPPMFETLIDGLHKSLKYPIDYTGTAILTAISTMMGTTAKVKVKQGWEEYGSLYTCILGDAGANKSHPISTVFEAIKQIDKQSHDAYVSKYKDYEAYSNLTAREKQGTTPILEPILKKMVLTNFTPEVLNKRLNDNPKGCTVVSDELATFFEGMNNYSKSDNSSNYLSIYSNQAITIDRMGKKLPLFIERPYLSIIGGLQTRMLSKVFNDQKLNSGFFQRFLFSYPQNVYKQAINDEELNPQIMVDYSEFIKKYIADKIETRELNWSPEAKIYFHKWQAKNCDLVNNNRGNIEGEIISKFDIHFIRLSLILQIMSDPNSNEIALQAVQGSQKLCEYYLNCVFSVLGEIQNPKKRLRHSKP